MRMGFSCSDFSPTCISESDLLILHSLKIQREEIYIPRKIYLFFKGENKISLINYPLEVSVYLTGLERLLRMINSFSDLCL